MSICSAPIRETQNPSFPLNTILPTADQGKFIPKEEEKYSKMRTYDKFNCPQKQHYVKPAAINGILQMLSVGDERKLYFWW